MIHFFRTIRQNLLSHGQTGKYLKYALGEIVLVVIGILIALSINNWNERNKERAIEKNYLKNIKSDLQKEISNNEYFIDFRYSKAEAASYLLNTNEPDDLASAENYAQQYENLFMWSTYVPNNNTFKELLSSGKLSIISNDTLKNKLQELNKTYERIANNENHMRREFEFYLYDEMIKNGMALVTLDNSKAYIGFPDQVSVNTLSLSEQEDFIRDTQVLYHNTTFNNGLKLAHMNNSSMTSIHQNLAEAITDLIHDIKLELEK